MELTEIGVASAQSAAAIQIFVESIWFGKTITLNVQASDPVDRVKAQIQGMKGIPMTHQDLFFQDQFLEDAEPLNSHEIGDKSTLYLEVDTTYLKRSDSIPLIQATTGTQKRYELLRPEQKVGNIGCRLCWTWMGPSSEQPHWNSQKTHGRKLRAYMGPPDANNFKEVKTSAADHDKAAAEVPHNDD